MGACSSFHPKNLEGNTLPVKSKVDHPYAININFSVLLEIDEDLKHFQNEKSYLMIYALNQKFTEKHIDQKISHFYKGYTLNQYYMDFLLSKTEFDELLDKEIDLHLFFYNERFYFEKKSKLFIRSEAKEGFISDDELIELDLIKGNNLFKNTKKKIKIGVKYRLYGDFIYDYVREDQKKFLSFYKFFEFLTYSDHCLLDEYYQKNVNSLNQILSKFRNQRNNNNFDNDYLNQEFNNALDSLFTYYYKKNLRLKSSGKLEDVSYLKVYQYDAYRDELEIDGNMLTEKKLIDQDENKRIFRNNNIQLQEINLKMDFQQKDKIINAGSININLINEKNIEKDYELNPEKQRLDFIDYETLLTKAFYKHDPIKQDNSRNIQYNIIQFAKKHMFELLKIIWRDYNSNSLKENFLNENLFNILYAASSGNYKMLNIFEMIFRNDYLYEIYQENMNFTNILSLLKNSQLKDEISKYDILPYLLIPTVSRKIILDSNNFDAIKKVLIHHKNGQAKLDLIELLSNKPNLIIDLLNCKDMFEANHLRLYNLFAYIFTIREITELLSFDENIGKKNDKQNENIYEILSNIEKNYKKILLRDIDVFSLSNKSFNRQIDFNFILRFCDEKYLERINEEIFTLFDNFRNDLLINNHNESLSFINKNLKKFIMLIFKFTKIPLSNLNRILDKSLLIEFSEIIYSQIDLLDYEEINFFLENKFEFIIEALFSGELSEAAVRKIVILIINNENAFALGNKKPLKFGLEENAAYKKNFDEEAHLIRFNQLVDKNYLENFIKSKVLSDEKSQFPFYVLSAISKIKGVLEIVSQNVEQWKEFFCRNSSFEKFYEINFFEEYRKITQINLQTNALYADQFLNNQNYKNISASNYPSERENDIELSDVKVISKESFSFNQPKNISILLKDKNHNPFYPSYIYLQQPKEETDSNVKSALFLSGRGDGISSDKVNSLIKSIEDVKDYTKVDYGNLKFLGYIEYDKIKKGLYKELRTENTEMADFILVILISNFENEIILTTGPFGCFGAYNVKERDYILTTDFKYLKDKFLHDEL